MCEGAKQARLLVRGDADPGVAHLETQQMLGARFAQATQLDVDAAAFGELDGVADQIAQHLAQADRVAAHQQAHRRFDIQAQAQLATFGGALQQLHDAVEQFAQVEGGDFQFELVGLELGVIEDVVDDAQQLQRTTGGGLQHVALVQAELAAGDQLQHRNDAVKRGADLVAHGGQEFALGQRGGFGSLFGAQ